MLRGLLIIGTWLVLTGCSREVAQEIAHEAAVCEQAIEKDLQERSMVDKSAPMYPETRKAQAQPDVNFLQIKNHRQYPKRNQNRSYKDKNYES